MAKAKGLSQTEDWNQIAFPVQLQEFSALMPGYESVARDRQKFIVGRPPQATKPVIFGLQGNNYSLFPNQLIRDVAGRVLGRHTLQASYSDQGEFSLTLTLPEERFEVVSPKRPGGQPSTTPDTLQKAIIITNSYSGKSPFTIQGKVLSTQRSIDTTEIAPRMRISYYRLVCGNGLMGWADEFMSLDEYVQWLAEGQPTRHTNVRETNTFFEPARIETTEHVEVGQETTLAYSRIRHTGFTEADFEKTLSGMFNEFVSAQDSLTAQMYTRLAEHTIKRQRAESYLKGVKVPKKLVQLALERMDVEVGRLAAKPNLWLLYNGLNHALFHQPTSLTINQRYDLDGSLFHQLNHAVL